MQIYILVLVLITSFCMANEIEIPCDCTNDCDRKAKCEWILDIYTDSRIERLATPLDDDIDNSGFRESHFLSLLHIVDAGTFGCATVWGRHEDKLYRYDFSLIRNNGAVKLLEFNLANVKYIPSLEEYENLPDDQSCLFVLP